MKKIRLFLAILLPTLTIVLAGPVLAAPGDPCSDNDPKTVCNVLDPICQNNPEAVVCQENIKTQTPENNSLFGPKGVLTTATNIIAILVGIATVIMVIVGGFQYVMSTGDPTKVNNAKNIILYALAGMIVTLAARGIILFIVNRI